MPVKFEPEVGLQGPFETLTMYFDVKVNVCSLWSMAVLPIKYANAVFLNSLLLPEFLYLIEIIPDDGVSP